MKNDIELIIEARDKDLGIPVKRILPWTKKRMVGPFIFLDHMGPAHLHPPTDHMDVRPHPHIGLSTLTYLFKGQILHKDSTGVTQLIFPGEVNWMTAGSGISHSEREPQEVRHLDRTIDGLQFWVALPLEKEDITPTFDHYDSHEIPSEHNKAHDIKVVAGFRGGKVSPLKNHSPLLFQVVKAKAPGVYTQEAIPTYELAVYLVEGSLAINGKKYEGNQMVVFKLGSSLEIQHSGDALFAVIGGEPFPEPRFIFWNFVSSSQEKIELAKKAWEDGTFPQVPGDSEIMPLPK